MSYCVNCGVELEQSLRKCPLCNTPVYHPEQVLEADMKDPYPSKKGEVGRVKKTDQAILISVLFSCTAIGCGLLNLLVFKQNLWSLYIIGACAVLWIFCAPAMLYQRLPFAAIISLDGIAVALYCFVIAYQFNGRHWYFVIALPIIIVAVILVIAIYSIHCYASQSILVMALVVVLAIAVFCVVINLCISYFIAEVFTITWSAIVLTCAVIIALTLFTIMRVSRLREEVRRRMHI